MFQVTRNPRFSPSGVFAAALSVAFGFVALTGPVRAAAAADRFRATIPDGGAGEAGELRTPLQFEEEAADHPQTGSQSLFSRCRKAPFDGSVAVFGPIVPNEFDAIVGDTLFYFADGTSCYNPQNEQNIVINPSNPQNVVTSANEYRGNVHAVYYSRDGGQSWSNVFLPGWTRSSGGAGVFSHMDSCGDPVLAFSPDGKRLYYSGLVCNFDKFPRTMSGVAVAVSQDGGATWAPPTMVDYRASGDFFNDKEWLTTGPGDAVYVTWTKFYQGPRGLGYLRSPIVMASSSNGGKSWSSVKAVSDDAHPYNQGSQVLVAPNGVVYVAYEGSDPTTGYATDQIVVARSTDGGTSFVNSQVGRAYDDLDCYPLQLPGAQGRQTLTNEQFRINSFPSMAIDPTTGHLAIVWADNEGAGNCGSGGSTFSGVTSNQVKLITSADGLTWTAPTKITSGSADKVYPSVGSNAGRIVVGYYTRAYSPVPTTTDRTCGIEELDSTTGMVVPPTDPARAAAAVCLDWAIRSSDDDFAAETRVTSESSNPYILFAGSFIGDYTGTAVAANGKAVTVWTDFRGNPGTTTANQDVVVGIGY
jgi:hypothetical protein